MLEKKKKKKKKREEKKMTKKRDINEINENLIENDDIKSKKKHKKNKKKKKDKKTEVITSTIEKDNIKKEESVPSTKEEEISSKSLKPDKAVKACEYLMIWHKAKSSWKFQKVRQVYLLQNKFEPSLIDKKHFKILLKYLIALKGQSRQQCIDDCIKKRDTLSALEPSQLTRELKIIKKRALDILNVLEE